MKLIGLDIGTTSLCGISCDAATGQILQTITEQNGTFLPAAEPWEKQQDAAALVARMHRIAAALAADGAFRDGRRLLGRDATSRALRPTPRQSLVMTRSARPASTASSASR